MGNQDEVGVAVAIKVDLGSEVQVDWVEGGRIFIRYRTETLLCAASSKKYRLEWS